MYEAGVGPRAGLDELEERDLLPPSGTEPRFLGFPVRIIVAVPTTLSMLPVINYFYSSTALVGQRLLKI